MKLGLVCEGGAYRAMFTSGVLDVLLEEGIQADCFVGVSAGIAYGISYASKQPGRNREILTRFAADPRYLSAKHLFVPGNRSIYGREFAFHTVPDSLVPLDYDALAAFPGEIYAVTTDLDSGEAAYLPVPRDRSAMPLMEASCAMPLLFPPIDYGDRRYLDGGIADPIPYDFALTQGCDKLIVVLTRERSYRKGKESFGGLMGLYYRKTPAFVEAVRSRSGRYNAQRDRLFGLEEKGEAILFCPESTEGFSRMEKDPEKLEGMYQQGISAGREGMAGLRAYLAL